MQSPLAASGTGLRGGYRPLFLALSPMLTLTALLAALSAPTWVRRLCNPTPAVSPLNLQCRLADDATRFFRLDSVTGMAIGPDGDLYLAGKTAGTDSADVSIGSLIVRADRSGRLHTIAGSNDCGFGGDGGPAVGARLNGPHGLAWDRKGALYLADACNHRIRRVSPDGTISTVAGTGTRGFAGDGGLATRARLSFPRGVAIGPDSCLYIADSLNRRIRRVSPEGTITTVAGGKGRMGTPWNLTFDHRNRLLIVDVMANRVWRLDGGRLIPVAGTGEPGSGGDEGPAIRATLNMPRGLAVDRQGRIYVADSFGDRIRRIDPDGTVRTVVGDKDSSTDVFRQSLLLSDTDEMESLSFPVSVAVTIDGTLFIADTGNGRILRRKSCSGRQGD